MLSRRWLALLSLGLLSGGVLASGVLATRSFKSTGSISAAAQAIKLGQPFHAVEIIDRDRAAFGRSEEGCQVALNAYAQIRKIDALGWMIESCEALGFQGSDLFIAKSLLFESLGDPNASLEVLAQAASKFPGRPQLYVQMARIYLMHGRKAEAQQAWWAAVDQAPRDVGLSLEALRFFHRQGAASPEVRKLALKLKNLPEMSEPSTLLFLASVLERSGDSVTAHQLKQQAQKLFGPAEGFQKRYAATYPELFESKVRR